ncbi:unnamed protein product, partial [Ectocarpus fasciculatus]
LFLVSSPEESPLSSLSAFRRAAQASSLSLRDSSSSREDTKCWRPPPPRPPRFPFPLPRPMVGLIKRFNLPLSCFPLLPRWCCYLLLHPPTTPNCNERCTGGHAN